MGSEMCIRDRFGRSCSPPFATTASGTLSGLSGSTRYFVEARLTQNGRVVDTATASFTTDEEPYTGPAPSITLNFSPVGGRSETSFGWTFTGLDSFVLELDLSGARDVDESVSGLDPTRSYSGAEGVSRLPAARAIHWNEVQGLRVRASGPGGTITVTYGDPGGGVATRAFYANRGWTVGGLPVDNANVDGSRTFGPGSYT